MGSREVVTAFEAAGVAVRVAGLALVVDGWVVFGACVMGAGGCVGAGVRTGVALWGVGVGVDVSRGASVGAGVACVGVVVGA